MIKTKKFRKMPKIYLKNPKNLPSSFARRMRDAALQDKGGFFQIFDDRGDLTPLIYYRCYLILRLVVMAL